MQCAAIICMFEKFNSFRPNEPAIIGSASSKFCAVSVIRRQPNTLNLQVGKTSASQAANLEVLFPNAICLFVPD